MLLTCSYNTQVKANNASKNNQSGFLFQANSHHVTVL